LRLPFVSYSGRRVVWYLGWQPSGFFGAKFNLHHALLQDVELMPQYQDFGFQPQSRLEEVAQHAGKQETDRNHSAIMF
jgi:hypothetical protein